jgi:hypothetical protein
MSAFVNRGRVVAVAVLGLGAIAAGLGFGVGCGGKAVVDGPPSGSGGSGGAGTSTTTTTTWNTTSNTTSSVTTTDTTSTSVTTTTTPPADCQQACTVLFDCTQQDDLCPGLPSQAGPMFIEQCMGQCEQNPVMIAIIDPEDCPGTIALLKAANADFAALCEGGAP